MEFKEGMDPLKYLEQRRKLVDQMSCYFGGASIYTLLGIFSLKAHVFYRTFAPLFKKESFFTSFMHFIRTFEHTLYPNLDSVALGALHNRKQLKTESVSQYFTDFSDLIFIIGREKNDYIQPFLSGLYNRALAHTMSNAMYPEGARTLDKLADHARHIESQINLSKAFNDKGNNQSDQPWSVSALSNSTDDMEDGSMSAMAQGGRGFSAQRQCDSSFDPPLARF